MLRQSQEYAGFGCRMGPVVVSDWDSKVSRTVLGYYEACLEELMRKKCV